MEGALGLRFPFRSSHASALKPQILFRAHSGPPLTLCSPNRIMVQMLKWLHVLIKVDVHSEGGVCVMCRVEIGDGTGSEAQASEHCGGARGKDWGGGWLCVRNQQKEKGAELAKL